MLKSIILGMMIVFISLSLVTATVGSKIVPTQLIHCTNVRDCDSINPNPEDVPKEDNNDVVEIKSSSGSECISEKWIVVDGEWTPEDYTPIVLKNNPDATGYKVVPGKYCIVLDENGRTVPKPDSVEIKTEVADEIKVNVENLVISKEDFMTRLFSFFSNLFK